jgi:hypothetical protein
MSKWANEQDGGNMETSRDHAFALIESWFKALFGDSGEKAAQLRKRQVQAAEAKHKDVSQNPSPEPTDKNAVAMASKLSGTSQKTRLHRRPANTRWFHDIRSFSRY